jgi:hypothetical protein
MSSDGVPVSKAALLLKAAQARQGLFAFFKVLFPLKQPPKRFSAFTALAADPRAFLTF